MSAPILASSAARGWESKRQSLRGATRQRAQLRDCAVPEPGAPAEHTQHRSAFPTRQRTPSAASGRPDPQEHDASPLFSYGRPKSPATCQILEAATLPGLQNALDERG